MFLIHLEIEIEKFFHLLHHIRNLKYLLILLHNTFYRCFKFFFLLIKGYVIFLKRSRQCSILPKTLLFFTFWNKERNDWKSQIMANGFDKEQWNHALIRATPIWDTLVTSFIFPSIFTNTKIIFTIHLCLYTFSMDTRWTMKEIYIWRRLILI